jgi:hypothetical protein
LTNYEIPPGLVLGSEALIRHAIRDLLPPDFHKAGCVWSLSASSGLTTLQVLKCHIWFWLDRPVTSAITRETFRQRAPGETVELSGLSPEPFPVFALPAETPEIFLDLGEGEQRIQARLHTLSIRPDERSFDLVWGGALRYAGYQWLPKLKRLDARVRPE